MLTKSYVYMELLHLENVEQVSILVGVNIQFTLTFK